MSGQQAEQVAHRGAKAASFPVMLTLDTLGAYLGQPIGPGPWHSVDQQRINGFADLTGDQQWIHVDPERARTSPFGGAIAHGYLTLSLLPVMQTELRQFSDLAMVVNYGLDRVRFPSPVPAGAQVRLTVTPLDVEARADGSFVLRSEAVVEVSGGPRPACVAHTLTLLRP